MAKFLFYCILFITGSIHAFTQQDPHCSMFFLNPSFFNPASIGAHGPVSASFPMHFRDDPLKNDTYWDIGFSIEGYKTITSSPRNQIGGGMLLYVQNDPSQSGFGERFSLCYRRKTGLKGILAAGLYVGIVSKSLYHPDSIFTSNKNGLNYKEADVGLGVYYQTDLLHIGAAVTHVTESGFTHFKIPPPRQIYLTGGYCFLLGKKGKVKLNPNLMVRTDFTQTYFDLNLNTLYDLNHQHGFLWGMAYHYPGSIGISAGYKVNLMKGKLGCMIAYEYNINVSRWSSARPGIHEIALRINMNGNERKNFF
jgi:type IX secretion system PorP/SprF family membrane protein